MGVAVSHKVKFPSDGKVCEGDGYTLYTLAEGRNGTCEIKALDIHVLSHTVQLTPITRKRGIAQNCWIENEDENIRTCTKCGAVTSHERRDTSLPLEGDNCDLCGEWICVDCTAYTYMAVEKIESPVCIHCADEESKDEEE